MKIKITIKGEVHDVGYRLFLLSTAERFGIKKFFAENVKINDKKAVLCYVEGSDEQINEFKDFILKEKPEEAVVESINFEDYDGFVMDIDNYHRFFSAHQLYKIASYGAKMIKKQDETIKVIREESGKTRQTVREESEKTREELGKIIQEESEKTRVELKGEIRGVKEGIANLRLDLKEYMESNLKRIYGEIAEIKEALKKAGIM
jgi:acylphosphatase